MRKALLVVLILSSALAWAQGGCRDKELNGQTTGGFLKAVGSASIRVCTDSASPCTLAPHIYSDAALTQSLANPISLDGSGNYHYCATPGNYNEQISGSAFSTLNNTPVTIASSAAVYTDDSSQRLGADMCAKIVASANAMVSAGRSGAVIDATNFHGSQACANGLNGWPWTPGATPTFAAKVLLAPDVYIQTAVRFQVPTHTEIDGQTSHGDFFGSTNYTGAWIGPATGYSDTVVVELGASNSSGGTPPQGARLKGIGVTCQNAAGNSALTGGVGIINQYSQERSGWTGVHISGCTVPFDIEVAGTLGGAINAGPYEDTHATMENVADIATAGGFRIGTNSVGLLQVGTFSNLWISCTNATGKCPFAGYVDAGDVFFKGETKMEGSVSGIRLGSAHNVLNVRADDFICVASSGSPSTNCVQSSGTVRAADFNVKVIGTSFSTNMVADTSTGGKTITTASQGTVPDPAAFWYKRTMADSVQTDAKGQASTLATMNELVQNAGFTISNTQCGTTFALSCTAGACTVNLPATIPVQTCDYWFVNNGNSNTTPSVWTISGNGATINGSNSFPPLIYDWSAHCWPNSGGTTWRCSIAAPSANAVTNTLAASTTFSPWATQNTLVLGATAVTSSTLAAMPDDTCTVLRIQQDATGGRTFTYPGNVVGQMTLNTAASKTNRQMFCYSTASSKWEAQDAGVSF